MTSIHTEQVLWIRATAPFNGAPSSLRRDGFRRTFLYCTDIPLGAKEVVVVGDVGSLVLFVETHSSRA